MDGISEGFDKEKVLGLSSSISIVNILANIESYNDEMTISQVVRFFERHGLNFTKTMIQNYIRVGLIPPPLEKRYYTKKHLILLTIIDSFKDIYSLDEIGRLFKPILKDTETFDDDIIDMSVIYNEFYRYYQRAINDWAENLPKVFEDIAETAKSNVSSQEDQETVTFFLSLMSLMAHSIATKQLANLIMNKNKL
ncbi:DUF1836 domain-containing protein [Anaeropeptidivorans aminofermentans]|jgi:DNA-binding transcriptional MerR regulator|uniref:DUF1836 domain-containing protein n=1 Tax=Anaeropeptidivorans aminofermentans TaxID=2934315 RepID=UPI000ED80050|nr:DUF1836 domain-containing protein [Anaeropeptidivorans aminofermentans]MBE6010994.1 DUF1836 domain-containing protein [Lachnospiraceae bacterium]HAQ40795.1 hypothetical protein [Clostridiales bacterium]